MGKYYQQVRWREHWAIAGALIITICLLLLCMGGGIVVRAGRLPSFYTPVWFANKQAVIFYSGEICPVGEWRAACDMGLQQRVFSVMYWTPTQSYVLLSLAE